MLKHFADRKRIAYPLLSDAGSSLIRELGILNESIPKNSPFYGVPHPVTLIVDRRGEIVARHAEDDYRNRPTVGSILGTPATRSSAGETPRFAVTASATDGTVRGGEKIRLFVEVKLGRGVHVYAPGVKGYIPIDWTMSAAQPVDARPVVFPPSRILHLPAIGERVPVFERTFTLSRDVIVSNAAGKSVGGDGKLVLEGTLRLQACDDTKCYVPEEVPLRWAFAWEPHDAVRVPPELRRVK